MSNIPLLRRPHFAYSVVHQWTLGLHSLLFFTIVNHVATNVSVQIPLSVLWDIYSEVEFLDHMVILFLIFWGTAVLFSIDVAALYNATLADFFYFFHLSTNCQEWGTEFSNDCCWIFSFSFQLSQSFIHLLWANWKKLTRTYIFIIVIPNSCIDSFIIMIYL